MAGVSGCLGAVALALSCIADLPPDAPPGALAPKAACGDGYIDLAAGEECDPGSEATDAATGGCSATCKIVCSGLTWAGNDHCYELRPAVKSFKTEAVTTCQTAGGGHVVTFASEAELDAAAGYAGDAGMFWVGLWESTVRYASVAGYEPGWAPTCPGCFAHTPTPASPLPRSALLAADAAAGCVAGSPDLQRAPSWVQVACDNPERLRLLCEREPVGHHSTACEAGVCIDLVFTRGEKRYVYGSQSVAAPEAEQRCGQLGGKLVVLETRDEREQLWHELALLPSPPARVWIGLVPLASDGAVAWTWDDGTRADVPDAYPSPWGSGEPATTTTRAFLDHVPTGAPGVDDTLARSNALVKSLPYVCQVRVSDGGR